MNKYEAWEKLAHRYNNQWVQKYSLKPTRIKVMEALSNEFDEDKNINILDIGCGTGQIAECILERYRNANYLGIDVSKNMIIEASKQKLESASFKNCSIEEFEIDKEFDVIICTHALPYFEEKKKIIKKIYDKLKPNGILILAGASEDNLYDKIIMPFVKLHTSKAQYLSSIEIINILKQEDYKEIHINFIKEKMYMPTIFFICAKKVIEGDK